MVVHPVGTLTASDIVGLTLTFDYNDVSRKVKVETAVVIGEGDGTWGRKFLLTGRDEARNNQYRSFKLFELEILNAVAG